MKVWKHVANLMKLVDKPETIIHDHLIVFLYHLIILWQGNSKWVNTQQSQTMPENKLSPTLSKKLLKVCVHYARIP